VVVKGPQQEEGVIDDVKNEVRELGQVVTCVTDILEVGEKTTVA